MSWLRCPPAARPLAGPRREQLIDGLLRNAPARLSAEVIALERVGAQPFAHRLLADLQSRCDLGHREERLLVHVSPLLPGHTGCYRLTSVVARETLRGR